MPSTPAVGSFETASTSTHRCGLRSHPASTAFPPEFGLLETTSTSTETYRFQNHLASMASHPEFALFEDMESQSGYPNDNTPGNDGFGDNTSGNDGFGDNPGTSEQKL
jgi:hypothetical protein